MRIIEFAHFIMHKNHIWVNFGARRTFTDSTRSTVPLVFLLSLSLYIFLYLTIPRIAYELRRMQNEKNEDQLY